VHASNLHSLIAAHVKDTSATVRAMMAKLLASYPVDLWDGGERDEAPALKPFERTINTRLIAGRDCKITICSAENQDSVRGQDISIAHLSEVAFWKDTPQHSPTDLMRSLVAGIAPKPLSVVVMESTANGVGNYFHREWMRANSPEGSDKEPFFVPWHELDIYTLPVPDPVALIKSMDAYDFSLWEKHGCTLEAIAWYKERRREYPSHRDLMAEFPTEPVEAFAATGSNVFATEDIERLRRDCREPDLRGEVYSDPVRWVPSDLGCCQIWQRPEKGAEYVASVDIGGRSRNSDWSVITVIRTGPTPEIVAQWRGHIDHDLLARRAAALASFYNTALLVIESNTWETQSEGHGRYILDLLTTDYPNLYFRNDRGGESRVGFHTNVSTKSTVISHLIALVREGGYVERSHEAADELASYEHLPNGTCSARAGCHDDLLMSRAIGLWVATREHLFSHPSFNPADFLAMASPVSTYSSLPVRTRATL
ncbi:MAG: hypothetical protein K2K55_09485, partial [Duncaniella sp.]|nr:hypothetical protein [Duncaniella sp.]